MRVFQQPLGSIRYGGRSWHLPETLEGTNAKLTYFHFSLQLLLFQRPQNHFLALDKMQQERAGNFPSSCSCSSALLAPYTAQIQGASSLEHYLQGTFPYTHRKNTCFIKTLLFQSWFCSYLSSITSPQQVTHPPAPHRTN